MAEYVLPKRGVEYIFYVGLVDQADTKKLKANPTIAAGDFKISKDGGAFANLTTLPSVTPAAGTAVKITVSATEAAADNIVIACIDAAGAEWCDLFVNIQTATRGAGDLAFPTTSGRSIDVAATGEVGLDFDNVKQATALTVLANVFTHALHSGTAQAGAAGTVTLAAGASAVNDLYNDALAVIVSGTGAGQARLASDYVGATKVLSVTPDWATAPDNTSVIVVVPAARVDLGLMTGGTVAAGAVSASGLPKVSVEEIVGVVAAAVRLGLSAGQMIPGTVDDTALSPTTTQFEADDITEATADHYKNRLVLWTSGAMAGQVGQITAYALNGGRGRFTISTQTEAPANDVTFLIV